MTQPLSLPMMKMEKNFIAHIEKKYSRKPYEEYPIIDPKDPAMCLIGFVTREKAELDNALDLLLRHSKTFHKLGIITRDDISKQIINSMWEVADVSNTLDYLFEGLIQALKTWEADIGTKDPV